MEIKVSTERKNSRNGQRTWQNITKLGVCVEDKLKKKLKKKTWIIDLLKVNMDYILIKNSLLSI